MYMLSVHKLGQMMMVQKLVQMMMEQKLVLLVWRLASWLMLACQLDDLMVV
jgi:hypothetical protein